MRGHEPLLAMRRKGLKPAGVWFALEADEGHRSWPQSLGIEWRRWPNSTGHATVQIDPADSIGLLDLRFVVGLTAWVQGEDRARVERLHQACQDFGAARVLSCVMGTNHRGQPKLLASFDTDGHFALETA